VLAAPQPWALGSHLRLADTCALRTDTGIRPSQSTKAGHVSGPKRLDSDAGPPSTRAAIPPRPIGTPSGQTTITVGKWPTYGCAASGLHHLGERAGGDGFTLRDGKVRERHEHQPLKSDVRLTVNTTGDRGSSAVPRCEARGSEPMLRVAIRAL